MPVQPSARLAAACLLLLPAGALAQSALPDGPGREVVEANCTACHGVDQITDALGYDAAGWRKLALTMVYLDDDPALDTITAYLAAHFPPSDARARVPVDGAMAVDFQAWSGPTRGQRARDPVEAPDGAIWWTGQWADVVSRLDPATGEIREYPLPSGTRAHTVAAAADGMIWYTGNGNATMGRLDPETGEVTVYPMPDPAARDPHSAIIAADGRVFFTAQGANMVGRVDPAPGEITLVTMPVADSRPYGIKLAADGTVWVASNGANRLYSLDPESLDVTGHAISDPGTRIRRLDIAQDGTIWFVNSSLGRLGHYDPATRAVREWESPSGPVSHPYAIAVLDGAVWYNESGVRPDMLVRFDPASETFQSWRSRRTASIPASSATCARPRTAAS